MAQQKILLHRIETNTLLPVTSSLSNLLTVIVGFTLFSEVLSLTQVIATSIILVSVFLYSRKKGGLVLDFNSISLGLGIIVTSTFSKMIQKIGSGEDSLFHFAVYQSLGAVVFSFFLIYFFEKKTIPYVLDIQKTWKVSLACGFFISLAGFAFIKALSIGPMSGVYSIAGGYIFITAILGVFFYKETLTQYKIILLMMVFVGIVLMKLG